MTLAIDSPFQRASELNWAQGYWRLAAWDFSTQETLSFLKAHLDLGVTLVDHADIYGDYRCEKLFGNAISLQPSIRQHLHVVTKCDIQLISANNDNEVSLNHYDTSAKHIRSSVERSLARLQTDHIDTLLLHRPDLLMDVDEVVYCFNELRMEGKVGAFGVSNFSGSQFELLNRGFDRQLVTNQVELNPINFDAFENGAIDHLQMAGVRPMAWSCLGGGGLFNPQTEQAHRVAACLSQLAKKYDTSVEGIVYAWVLRHPSKPIVINGSGKTERLANAIARSQIVLSREDWYRVWVASKGHGVP
jgi:predicted oxidoreductase